MATQREVRAAARLSHPNVVTAHDAKATLGLLYDYDRTLSDDDGDGTIDAFEQLLRILANQLYCAINEQG